MTDPCNYGIYANMTGVYWWDPCYLFFAAPLGSLLGYQKQTQPVDSPSWNWLWRIWTANHQKNQGPGIIHHTNLWRHCMVIHPHQKWLCRFGMVTYSYPSLYHFSELPVKSVCFVIICYPESADNLILGHGPMFKSPLGRFSGCSSEFSSPFWGGGKWHENNGAKTYPLVNVYITMENHHF